MGLFKNDVGRPTNKSIMIRNILKAILVVIIATGIFAGGYFLNGNQKKEDKKDASIIAKEVYKYYSDFTYAPPLDEFYTEKGALQKKLPENIMLTIATSNLKEKKCKGKYEGAKDNCYNATEIKNMVDKLFGYKVTFNKDTSISVNCNGYSYSSKYNEFYMGGGLGTTEEFVKAMYDYKLDSNTLYIYEVVGEYGFAANKYMLASGEEVEGELTKDILLKDKDLFNKYKWTFEKNSKGNYIYKSVKKINNGKNVTTTKKAESKEKNEVEKIIFDIFSIQKTDQFEHWLTLYDVNGDGFDLNSKEFKLHLALNKTKEITNKYSCNELFGNKDLTSYFSNEDLKDSNLRCDSTSRQFSYEDVNTTYKKLFGSKLEAPKETISVYLLPFVYLKDKNIFVELSMDTGDGGYPVVSGILDYNKDGNKLYVTYGIARAEDDQHLKLSDGSSVKISVDWNNYDETMKKYFDKYKDKLFKYKLVFENENNNYVFKTIEKIK